MKNHLTTPLLAATLLFGVTAFAGANDARLEKKSAPPPAAPAPAAPANTDDDAWMKRAVAAYPLNTCVVTGESLEGGEMGDPVNYIHKVPGQPDRLVRFCCGGCIKDFKKSPAKHLQKIDEAAAKAKPDSPAPAK